MDVKSTFLNGHLVEEVHVGQPLGFAVSDEDQALKLKKVLYRPWQAPRVWYAKLQLSLNSLGFMRSDHQDAIYTR
jgi:hypothetical protein